MGEFSNGFYETRRSRGRFNVCLSVCVCAVVRVRARVVVRVQWLQACSVINRST